MKRWVIHWLRHPARWWQFWWPQSGLWGILTVGLLLGWLEAVHVLHDLDEYPGRWSISEVVTVWHWFNQ